MKIRPMFRALALSAALLVLAVPNAAMAAELRSGPNAAIAPGETIDDDLFVAGETVTIAGRVTGDAYAAGNTVLVTGEIEGDLIAAGQQVVVDGTVTGDVRGAASVVTINGDVGGSLTGFAQQVNISPEGSVGGSLVAFGETITAFGPVGRGITAGAGTLQLGAPVGGEVLAWIGNLSIGGNARIAGDLEYHSEQEADIPAGTVAGEVRFERVEPEERQEPVLNGLVDFGSLIWLAGIAILGALAIVLAPRASAAVVEIGRTQPLPTFGWGLLALFAVPIAAVVVGITLVGLPLTLVLAILYGLGLLLAWPALSLVVGTELARLAGRGTMPILGALLIGLIVLHLVTHLPFLGGLVAFLGLAFGLGLLVQTVRRWRRPTEPGSTAAPAAVAA